MTKLHTGITCADKFGIGDAYEKITENADRPGLMPEYARFPRV
jgi:hypothetical protein